MNKKTFNLILVLGFVMVLAGCSTAKNGQDQLKSPCACIKLEPFSMG